MAAMLDEGRPQWEGCYGLKKKKIKDGQRNEESNNF